MTSVKKHCAFNMNDYAVFPNRCKITTDINQFIHQANNTVTIDSFTLEVNGNLIRVEKQSFCVTS